jgi:hypothetical protein
LFNTRLVPKGLGWVIMPIVGGVLGARIGYAAGEPGSFLMAKRNLAGQFDRFTGTVTIEARLWIAFSLLWMFVVIVVFLVFDPFAKYRWSGQEWIKFTTVLFGPVLVGLISIYLYSWAIAKPQSVSIGFEGQEGTRSAGGSQATSQIRRIVENLTGTGHLSKEDAARVTAYYDGLVAKHNGDAKAAGIELIQWLENEVMPRKRAAAKAPVAQQMQTYDPARKISFANLPPETKLGVIGKRRVAYLPDGTLLAETVVGGEKLFASIEHFRDYTGISGSVTLAHGKTGFGKA